MLNIQAIAAKSEKMGIQELSFAIHDSEFGALLSGKISFVIAKTWDVPARIITDNVFDIHGS